MDLSSVKKTFIVRLTLVGAVLTAVTALVYHLFIPERYFLWFPAIPVFFYLFGLFYIAMFEFARSQGNIIMAYMVCKVLKFILSICVMLIYGFAVRHEVLAFIATFAAFYFAFLIFETQFFLTFEAELKKQKNKKQ